MRVTQQDIARLANVSQATVSRVLSGDDRVETDIRQRVLAVIEEQNYQPDVRARSLRKQKAHMVGLVLRREAGDLQGDPFFSVFVSELLEYLSKTSYHLVVEIADSTTRQEAVYDEMLRSRRVDGLILVESEARDERIGRLQADDFPFVLIGNPVNGADLYSVDNDNVLAGELATRHLFEAGYERVGFLGGPEYLTVSRDRLQGYLKVVDERRGMPSIWYSDFGLAAARSVAEAALRGAHRPDALVVLDDHMAMGVVQAARELGVEVPDQLGLVSFNDTNVCELLEGGLTSVSLQIPSLVQHACDRLLALIDGGEPAGQRRLIVPCELQVRGSSIRGNKVPSA
jgi:DNA-binding LacI/PurR family transcriptional regulator